MSAEIRRHIDFLETLENKFLDFDDRWSELDDYDGSYAKYARQLGEIITVLEEIEYTY